MSTSTSRVEAAEMPQPSLSYHKLPLSQVTVRRESVKRLDTTIEIEGSRFRTTDRFWGSFFSRFGFAGSIFKYYDHQEVFDRIATRTPGIELRFCTERADEGFGRALAVSNPAHPVISPADCAKLLIDGRGENVGYHGGVMTSTHTPVSGQKALSVGGDTIHNRYTLNIPLDGYGDPSIYLSILRQVCENGMVAMAPAFRSDIKLGDDNPMYSIARALRTFDNEDGFGAIHQRLEAAQASPASLRECRSLHTVVQRLGDLNITSRYEKTVGDLCGFYGVANLDAISTKKLRLLPARNCRVYDLINLASEIATHHLGDRSATALNGWIGTTVSEEYDLEGTANGNHDFQDLFLTKPAAEVAH